MAEFVVWLSRNCNLSGWWVARSLTSQRSMGNSNNRAVPERSTTRLHSLVLQATALPVPEVTTDRFPGSRGPSQHFSSKPWGDFGSPRRSSVRSLSETKAWCLREFDSRVG